MLAVLNNIPTQLQPYVAPLVSLMAVAMGILCIVAFKNQGLKDEIRAHLVWIIAGLILIGTGGAFLLSFRV